METFHFRSMSPPGNLFSLKEKIGLSLCGRIYKKIACKNKVFLAVIIIFLVLISTPSAYAVFTVESQAKNLSNNQSSNLSSESYFLSNELVVKLKSPSKDLIKKYPKPDDTGIASLNNLNKKHGVSKFEQVAKPGLNSKKDSSLFNWYKITFEGTEETITKKSVEFGRFKRIIESYKSDPNIETVELNYKVTTFLTPNDTYYSSTGSWGQSYPDLWGMQIINASAAWNQTTGSSSIIVASIDTGVDRNHADIQGNMWVNTAEIPNNGIDDDKNGYVDDYYGWNWVSNTNDPMDDMGHGTHTAGTIAAVGNNGIGVVGVNWKSRIMVLKFLDSSGSGSLSNAIQALQYAADMGARVSSNSWGCHCISAAIDDAIQYEHDKGMVVVVAAGNSNADALDFSPASSDGAITVAATNHNDVKSSYSNWGQKIDVAAPGGDAASWGGIDDYILSLKASVSPMCPDASTVGTNYCIARGTSMATPHVAGLAALILSEKPNLTNEEVRQIIREGAVDLGTPGKDIYYGYGRIDVNGSISLANTRPLSPIITSPRSRTVIYGNASKFFGSVPGPNFTSYKLEAGAGRTPTSWTTLTSSITQVINGTLATVDTTQLPDGIYIFRLTAIDINGKIYQFQIHDIQVNNFNDIITSPVAGVAQGILNVSGTAQTINGLIFANYTLDWMGSTQTSWSTTGITLVNGGTQPIINGTLATWDTSNLTDGQVYILRLTVKGANGAFSQYSTNVKVDKDLVVGWPKLISRNPNCIVCFSMPVFADLYGDGNKEIVIASPDNNIYAFRKDGTNLPGFPVTVNSSDYFVWPPNVADLNNDGKKEIVAAATISTGGTVSSQGRIYVIRSDGTFYPGWPNPVLGIAQEISDGTPTIADLDGDGVKEIVVIDPSSKMMHAYHLDGSELAGFPKALPLDDLIVSGIPLAYPAALSIFDLDKDGKPEIAYGLRNKFYLFDNNGNILPGWPFVAPPYNNQTYYFSSSAAFGDTDGDGNLEVIAVGSNTCSGTNPQTSVYVWTINGSLLPGWPMASGSNCYTSSPKMAPSVADVNNDGKDEILAGIGSLTLFSSGGITPIGNQGVIGQPAISDINGDGKLEFAGTSYNNVAIINTDNSTYWSRYMDTWYHSPPVLADLNNDSKIEMGVVAYKMPWESGDLIVYLWEIPKSGSNKSKYEWPMFLHDSQRTSRLSFVEPPTTIITSPVNGSKVSGIINMTVSAYDNVGVTKVELYLNGALVGTKISSPFTFVWNTTQTADGIYTLQSKAYDTANNVGVSPLDIVDVSNTVDNTPPTTSITSPSNGQTVSGTINVIVSASSSTSISKVELYRNSSLVDTATSSPFTFIWNTTQTANGIYTLQSKAYDIANNVEVSPLDIVDVSNTVIDNTPPTVSITSPSNNSNVIRKSTVPINASASDNVGVVKVEFYVNGTNGIIWQCTDTTPSYTCNWNVPVKSGMTYSLQAKAYDAANNTGLSAIVRVTSN